MNFPAKLNIFTPKRLYSTFSRQNSKMNNIFHENVWIWEFVAKNVDFLRWKVKISHFPAKIIRIRNILFKKMFGFKTYPKIVALGVGFSRENLFNLNCCIWQVSFVIAIAASAGAFPTATWPASQFHAQEPSGSYR